MNRTVPFEVLMHAENALSSGESAMAVLGLWIDSISAEDEFHTEACRVAAVMSLVSDAVSELVKAREAYSSK